MKAAAKAQVEKGKPRTDERLIALCLKGDQAAWADLVEKYKNLIYSIPSKLGMYDEAADIFQSVCVDLLSDLPKLREPKALPKWLMQVSYHKCLQHRSRARRQVQIEDEDAERLPGNSDSPLPEEMLVQLQREQMVRDVVAGLPDRCGRMVHMLFYETPSRPYQQIARELGIATGSIGFIRGRCLTRLRKQLEQMGFQ